MSDRRPDFLRQFDIDLQTEGFDEVLDIFSAPVEAAGLTRDNVDAATMEAVYRGLVANCFPDHPTIQ